MLGSADRPPDILRTVFRTGGADRPVQIVLKRRDFVLETRDLSALPGPEREAAVAAFVTEQRSRPFDLSLDPLMRVGCLVSGADETIVVWSFHHILVDGWCIGILQRELSEGYAALAAGRTPPDETPLQFVRFVKWSEQRRGQRALDFWARYLDNHEQALAIPEMRGEPGVTGRRARTHRVTMPPALAARLIDLARTRGLTLNTVVQGLWGILLARLNDVNDVVFGAVVSTRPADLQGAEAMLGPCIGMLPVRVRFKPGMSAASLLQRLQETAPDWLDNSHCSLAEIQARLRSRGPLFGHYIVFENYPLDARFRGELQEFAPGLVIDRAETFMTNNYDFYVTCHSADGLDLDFNFNEAAIDPAHVADLGARLLHLASALVDAPETPVQALALMTPDERRTVIDRWGRGAEPVTLAPTVAALRSRVATEHGTRPALRTRGRVVTHGELQDAAERLARLLHSRHGISAGSTVAVVATAGEPMAKAMLACLSLGAAFVPVDPTAPAARNEHIMADCGARLVLAEDTGAAVKGLMGGPIGDRLVLALDTPIEEAADPAPLPAVPADAPAYILYTSGTTGAPKGVRVSQRALLNYVGWLHRDLGIGADSATALVTSPAFDLGYTGVFGALLLGGCLTLLDEDERRDVVRVCTMIADDGLTFLKATPSYLSMLLADGAGSAALVRAERLGLVLLGGEPQDFDALRRLRTLRPGVRLYNHYGPTEATIGCVAGPLDDLLDDPAPAQRIGRPIAGNRILLVNAELEPAPPGTPGELLVAGAGLSDGYVGNAAQDAARFVSLPWLDGTRAYRTGDYARWLPDGTLAFLGRRDDQVKIRGHRIVLAGVEREVRAAPGVAEAAVRAVVASDNGAELVAYIVPAKGAQLSPQGLRHVLATQLPEAMVPTRYVLLSKMPLTANGKIDRAALAFYDDSVNRLSTDPATAEETGTETEEALRKLWKGVLFVERVGLDDDFFGLGGHSIKAVLLVSKVRKELKRQLSIRQLFDHPTVRRLAAVLDGRAGLGATGPEYGLVPLRTASPGSPRAFFLPPTLGTSTVYKELVDRLDADVACHGLQCPGFDREEPLAPTLPALADLFSARVAAASPSGRVHLLGWSLGVHVALETAQRLESQGRTVHLVLIDAAPRLGEGGPDPLEDRVESFAQLRTRPHWGAILDILTSGLDALDVTRLETLARHNQDCLTQYSFTGRLKADIVCIEALGNPRPANMAQFGTATEGNCVVHRIGGNHYTMFQPPNLEEMTRAVRHALLAP
jgi:amino acid adenylation domain-containing protein